MNNEQLLLTRTALGDERAFKELFDNYSNVLGEYVLKLTGSLELAEEIVQDTFIKIWLKKEELQGVQYFKNYIFIICKNHLYSTLRKKSREQKLLTFMEQEKIEENYETVVDSTISEYRRLIDIAIESLPPQAQKVYLLSRDERMKYDQIADHLNISRETVKKHIQYAQKFITKKVQSNINGAILIVLLSPLVNS